MRITRVIHAGASIVSGPASQIAPDMKFDAKAENGEAVEPFLLGFLEQGPDGGQEAHLFLLDDTGKENLVKHLTGGLVAAPAGALADLPKMDIPKGRRH